MTHIPNASLFKFLLHTHTHTHRRSPRSTMKGSSTTTRYAVQLFLPPLFYPYLLTPAFLSALSPSLPQVLNMLQLWNTASMIMGSDLSWGVGARIAQVGRARGRAGGREGGIEGL
jgi:hypothetical protein